ncbi:MAG: phosphate butyryltransferase [Parasporobacterium sp.]|nr:phosphate butyryltransferase [Parasporobacterium sp.]
MVYKTFDEIIAKLQGHAKKSRMAVAAANDDHTLGAVKQAVEAGLVEPVLVGDKKEIEKVLAEIGLEVPEKDIYDEPDLAEAAKKAVALINEGKADFLMKGKVDSGIYLKAVVNKETGLGKGGVMSHFTAFECPNAYHKLIVPVDGGMVTYPTLEQKKAIIQNTVDTMLALGYDCPKVGVLACKEKLDPKMPETVDGDELKKMNQRGEITNCIVEGPISFDCATDKEIAAFKGFESPCAGDCDILVAPNIHAGNFLGKMLTGFCHAKMGGFIVGAKCPVIMTSRGSTSEEKFLSMCLAAVASMNEK